MNKLQNKLSGFVSQNSIVGKGPLSVMLVLTRKAKEKDPPYSADDFLTQEGGQVAGLGRAAVQSILTEHGISRVLAEEGGRTSRGSIKNMRSYVNFLNALNQKELLDFDAIEKWWVERVLEFFASQPFRLKIDASKSLRNIISDLIEAAFGRQRECPGTMVAGAVLQHLVGAKLELALPNAEIEHNGFAVADAPGDRKGDFLIGDTAIHVTTAPNEALIRKCCMNLAANLRPLIITTEDGVGGAIASAKNAAIADRLEILEIGQFIATNVLEWSGFQISQRPVKIGDLIDCYNQIISLCETDPSLKIEGG